MLKRIVILAATGSGLLAAGTSTSVTLQLAAPSAILGQSVTLTARVTPSTATGKVSFFDGVSLIGVGTLAAGTARFKTAVLPTGNRSLTAVYTGDSVNQPSRSTAVSMSVTALAEKGFQSAKQYGSVSFNRTFVVVDLNGDGFADIAASDFDTNQVSVLLGNGDGTFRPAVSYSSGLAPFQLVASDFNGDGCTDIAAANGATASSVISVFMGKCDGTLASAVNYPVPPNPDDLVEADFNADGIADLAANNFSNNSITVLLGNGDGTFRVLPSTPVPTGPLAIAVADFNGDGRADVVVNAGAGANLLLGNGDGTFKSPVLLPAGNAPNNLATADFNGDGRADLAITNNPDDTVTVLLGNGDGTFKPAANYSAPKGIQGISVGDFNGDGFLDLVTADGASNNINVLLGDGTGSFQPAVSYPAGASPIFVGVGDFDGDGRSDLAIADFRNTSVAIMLGNAVAEPVIGAVVNGASFLPNGLSPGLLFTVGGTGLGPAAGATAQLDSTGKIATSVAGVQLLVDGTPCPLIYVSQAQINAVAPYELASKVGRNVTVQAVYNNVFSNVAQTPVIAVSPAIFSLGNGQGAIRNQDQTVNGTSNPAARGSFISIYATGEGQTSPPGIDGALITDANTHPAAPITVTIGKVPATVQFQGSTEFYGFLQVNVQIPSSAPSGNDQVVLTTSGVDSPAGITVAVQ